MPTEDMFDVRDLSRGAPVGLATTNAKSINTTFNYRKGEVKEYISNPSDYLSRKVRDFGTGNIVGIVSDFLIEDNSEQNKVLSIDNPQVAKFMPHNSIIAYVDNENKKPIIAYPFFPPHISLPLKTGEQVWIVEENRGENNSFYYWMCRVVADRQIDDLNHTLIDRSTSIRELSNKYDKDGPVTDEEFLYSASSSEKFNNNLIPTNESLSGIQAESISFMEEFTSEPVPRTHGKCSDLLLQGSNNSTIQLTTEKFKKVSDLQNKTFLSNSPTSEGNIHTPLAGTIDMFVGKEKERLLELASLANPETEKSKGLYNVRVSKRLSNSTAIESLETSKIHQYELGEENLTEGDSSPRNVFARLYLSMKTSPDDVFEIENADANNKEITGPAAILYSDNTRVYAESSLKLYNYKGNSFIDMNEEGEVTIQSGEGETASKIILRPDGNIVIKPGSGGVLHLGGDESELAGVAVSVNTPVASLNGITEPQIPATTSTMGGTSFLGDPLSGYTSSKVLIKV